LLPPSRRASQPSRTPTRKRRAPGRECARLRRLERLDLADAQTYADDAVSGAETKKLVQRSRLLDVIGARPPFSALILRDASRFSGRDGDEAFGELKRIAPAGVEIWFYTDGTRFNCGTLGDNLVGFVRAEMNAEFRRQIAKWTYEPMERKARAGYVTGGRVFCYDNVRVNGHVERRANELEANIVRRIYELYAAGHGLPTIATRARSRGGPSATPEALGGLAGPLTGECPTGTTDPAAAHQGAPDVRSARRVTTSSEARGRFGRWRASYVTWRPQRDSNPCFGFERVSQSTRSRCWMRP